MDLYKSDRVTDETEGFKLFHNLSGNSLPEKDYPWVQARSKANIISYNSIYCTLSVVVSLGSYTICLSSTFDFIRPDSFLLRGSSKKSVIRLAKIIEVEI